MPCCFSKSEATKVHFSFGNQHDVPFNLPKEEGDRYLVTFLTCPAPERPKLTGRLVGSSSRRRITWGLGTRQVLWAGEWEANARPGGPRWWKFWWRKMPLLLDSNIKCRCPKFQLHLFKLNEDHSFYWDGEKPSCFFSLLRLYLKNILFMCYLWSQWTCGD